MCDLLQFGSGDGVAAMQSFGTLFGAPPLRCSGEEGTGLLLFGRCRRLITMGVSRNAVMVWE